MPILRSRPVVGWLAVVFLGLAALVTYRAGTFPWADSATSPTGTGRGRPVEKIPPGTVIPDRAPKGWTHLILLAKPRLASGDIDKIPNRVRRYAQRFGTVILANVAEEGNAGSARHCLDKVALGSYTTIDGKQVVVSSSTHRTLGADLDFIEARMLAENEASLDDVVQVVRTRTTSVFDARSIVLHDGRHRPMIVRHLIRVNPNSGKLKTYVWMLDKQEEGRCRMVHRIIQLLPPNLLEDREIHVDANKFTFGIPSQDAFAMVRISPGKPIRAGKDVRELARQPSYTAASLDRLVRELEIAAREATASDAEPAGHAVQRCRTLLDGPLTRHRGLPGIPRRRAALTEYGW